MERKLSKETVKPNTESENEKKEKAGIATNITKRQHLTQAETNVKYGNKLSFCVCQTS